MSDKKFHEISLKYDNLDKNTPSVIDIGTYKFSIYNIITLCFMQT